MIEAARRIALTINNLYATTPVEVHEQIDTARDEIANVLGLAGFSGSTEFIELANTIRPMEQSI